MPADALSLSEKRLIAALRGRQQMPPPFWLMRQAGRYLPEYRATREKAGGFVDLCLNPELACEVTLQPIRRYAMDAAILFSDILVVPYGLGLQISFEEGEGPKVEKISSAGDLSRLHSSAQAERLAPIYRAVSLIRKNLPAETALIGFAGAPWTVAAYMIAGGSSDDYREARLWAYRAPESFAQLIEILIAATIEHLSAQVTAGAEVLQLFDSWAGLLPEDQARAWCLEPAARIVGEIKRRHPNLPIILFPRGVGALYRDYARFSGADALSLDTTIPLDWAASELQPHLTLQGNLDPMALIAGGPTLDEAIERILASLGHGPFVFNLGHGILPQTPPDHVAQLAERIRAYRGARA